MSSTSVWDILSPVHDRPQRVAPPCNSIECQLFLFGAGMLEGTMVNTFRPTPNPNPADRSHCSTIERPVRGDSLNSCTWDKQFLYEQRETLPRSFIARPNQALFFPAQELAARPPRATFSRLQAQIAPGSERVGRRPTRMPAAATFFPPVSRLDSDSRLLVPGIHVAKPRTFAADVDGSA